MEVGLFPFFFFFFFLLLLPPSFLTTHSPSPLPFLLLLSRLVFLAVETSFEDAMVVLMIAEYAVYVIADGDPIEGNFWANIIVAIGKVGAVIAGLLMNKFWTPPETSDIRTCKYSLFLAFFFSFLLFLSFLVLLHPSLPKEPFVARGFRRLFLCTAIAGLMALGVPAAYYLHALGNTEAATGLIFVASFLFFFFATIPKIGFATLLQSISAEEDASGRIFGFAATFVTATDAALLMGRLPSSSSSSCLSSSSSASLLVYLVLSLLFEETLERGKTFWICGGLFVAVSAFEGFFGPYLMNLGGWFSCGSGARGTGTPSGYESDIRDDFPDASKAEKQSLLVN
jgi:hypothetical protein